MKRILTVIGVAAAVLVVVAAVALSFATTRHAPTMVGVVVASGDASLEATDQLGVQRALTIDRVVAPGASWIAVYNETSDGMGAARVGLLHVPGGESRGVAVPLDPNIRMSERVDVVLQADRGVPGVFEFDPTRFDTSPDKPYFVAGKRVQVSVLVRFGEMGNSFQE